MEKEKKKERDLITETPNIFDLILVIFLYLAIKKHAFTTWKLHTIANKCFHVINNNANNNM